MELLRCRLRLHHALIDCFGQKTLRLLIAENCHAQSLLLERMLNRLGYHRIAIATSLSEACLLGHCTGHPFDVLSQRAGLPEPASIYPPSARPCPSQPPWHVCPARWMQPALAPS
ncbi:TPA: hypothetical protein L3744_005544 [Pseudomonas aeruginosa]|uniref:hypothetical protein n=1 Tax=Pseudomonas aeruginosa TaxID=287 RepID=UPI001301718B|nr:hypothetical protein [Pseudomonas aeruginosa]HBN8606963.1 hypothetical protein [Pseudomonas aeruginosa]